MKLKLAVFSVAAVLVACGGNNNGNTGGGSGSTGGGSGSALVEVTADITANTTWTKDKTYVLKQLTYVNAGATLTVQAGTTIAGDPASALVVSRDAKLIAEGTAAEPIVFTSSQTAGNRGQGNDWGGIVFLGRAPINTTGGEEGAEGLAAEDRNKFGGGANPDSAYNCGTLKYVRVEFAGKPLSANNELNGVTLNACGTGTVIDYVQVHRGVDDGVEIFGGTVNVKHLVLSGNDDDGLDWDRGWSGKAQFVIVQQTQGFGNHGFEASSNPLNTALLPIARPVIYNATLVGRKPDTTNPGEGTSRGIILKEGTEGQMYNLVVTNFTETGLYVTSTASAAAWGTDLFVKNSIFFSNSTNDGVVDFVSPPAADGGVTDIGFDELAKLQAETTDRLGVDPQLTAATNVTAPNFKPATGSAVFTGGATPPSDGFFDVSATFVGAVGTDDWTAGWTAYPEN